MSYMRLLYAICCYVESEERRTRQPVPWTLEHESSGGDYWVTVTVAGQTVVEVSDDTLMVAMDLAADAMDAFVERRRTERATEPELATALQGTIRRVHELRAAGMSSWEAINHLAAERRRHAR